MARPHRARIVSLLLGAAATLGASLACSRANVPPPTERIVSGGATGSPTVRVTPIADEPSPMTSLPATTTAVPSPLAPPASPTFPPTPTLAAADEPQTIVYRAQAGDTLRAVAVRFGVIPADIDSTEPLPDEMSFIDPGQVLLIPRRLSAVGPADKLLPDSEVVFSPHAAEFDIVAFAAEQGGYLNHYTEYVGGRTRTGPEVVALVARDNSINPRLLLALLELQSGWVTNPSRPFGNAWRYPMGHVDPAEPGLYRQLTWLANEIGEGYYGWRAGTLVDLTLADGTNVRLAPDLNAGTVALQRFLALGRDAQAWEEALGPGGFLSVYARLFGDPWSNEYLLFEPGVQQPPLILPFPPGHTWAFTGGPHGAWEREAAWAALDFAPSTATGGCQISDDWAVAAAPGLVVRNENGVVVLDLDGDGREQTGWTLIYLHIAHEGSVDVGTLVEAGDRIGHPSCEGGVATGAHLHFVRKYNGEWILADGPLPFNLSGWVAHSGARAYEGTLTRGDQTVIACPCASRETYISR
jgi:murein DD-endopeptidase MepM/ murein hydrolase activator NlpD